MERTKSRLFLWLAALFSFVLIAGLVSVSAGDAADETTIRTLLGENVYRCGEMTLEVSFSEEEAGLLLTSDGYPRFFPFSMFRVAKSEESYCLSERAAALDEYGASVEITVKNGCVYKIDVHDLSCDIEDDSIWYDGTYINPDLPADGSMEYPWQAGATEEDNVEVSLFDGFLWVDGYGTMRDYDDPAERPWATAVGTVEYVSFGEMITGIGKNAFRGIGSETESGCFFMIGESDELLLIGESGFEGAKLDGSFFFPAGLAEIDSRAFAGASLSGITFYGNGVAIAEDAFAGVTADAYTILGAWDPDAKASFGGSLAYHELVRFSYEYVTEDGEPFMFGATYFTAGERPEYDLDVEADFTFLRWEVMEGKLDGDPTNSVISEPLRGNVKLKVYCRASESTEPEQDPCPFSVTKGGQPAEEGTDYIWDGEANDFSVLTSGLTLSMADELWFADARIDIPLISETPITLTLDGISLLGAQSMICAYAPNSEIVLMGENRVTSFAEDTPAIFGGSGLTLSGKGSLVLSVADSSRSFNGVGLFTEKPITDGLVVTGSALPNEEEDIGKAFFPDDGTLMYVMSDGSVCKTLIFSSGTADSHTGLWIGIAGGFLIAGFCIFCLIRHKKKTDRTEASRP